MNKFVKGAVATLAMLSLAACGSGGGDGSPAPSTGAPSTTEATTFQQQTAFRRSRLRVDLDDNDLRLVEGASTNTPRVDGDRAVRG